MPLMAAAKSSLMLLRPTTYLRLVIGLISGALILLGALSLYAGEIMASGAAKLIFKEFLKADPGAKQNLSEFNINVLAEPEDMTFDELNKLFSTAASMCRGVGVVLLVLAIPGLVAAILRWNVVMTVMVVFDFTLFTVLVIVGGLIFWTDSPVHMITRLELGKTIASNYKHERGDAFSEAINTIHYFVKCCGAGGADDFPRTPSSCCQPQYLTDNLINSTVLAKASSHLNCTPPVPKAADPDWKCTPQMLCENGNADSSWYYPKGCYDRLVSELLNRAETIALYIFIIACLLVQGILGILHIVCI